MDLNCDDNIEEVGVSNLEYVVHRDVEVLSTNFIVDQLESRLFVGEVVKSVEDAYILYCNYAHAKGFSVKRGDQRYFPGTNELQAKEFECSCEGSKDEKRSNAQIPVYLKPTSRSKCKAKLRITRQRGGEWTVGRFVTKHNHEMLAADQRHLLRSSRNISYAQKSILESMVNSGITVSNAVSYMENEAQGPQNLSFIRKDAYDYLGRMKKQTKVENGDASTLLHHFINKSNKESNFYWNVQLDDDNRVMNFFLRDSRCQADYEFFGDILSVDTTYRTNRYNLICAPFVGINHHRQNIMFGLAFMSDETESSFEWLFKTFLDSMNGKQPETIFTDQCQAMMNAIETIFPHSQHRLCQWHINQNAPSHLGSLNGDSSFKILWNKCMTHCESEEEFESTWSIMIDEYNLSGHKWLNGMYTLRYKWATAFSNHKFSAGLLATSRSEVTNAVLKRSADVYTLTVYKLFELEFINSLNMRFIEMPLDFSALSLEFKVKSHDVNSRVRHVLFNKETAEVKCSCQKFESMGILCKHILMVFNFLNVNYIPTPYLKKRWMKNAKNRVVVDDFFQQKSGSGQESEMVFVNQLMRSTYTLTMRCKSNGDARKKLVEIVEGAREQIDELFEKLKLDDNGILEENMVDEMVVRNPPQVKSRGITNKNIQRHWDGKSKKRKGKGKVDSSNAGCGKRKGQSSQASQCMNSQEVDHIQQLQNPNVPPSLTSEFEDNQLHNWVNANLSHLF
ncbi:protein FAR1-RELATED SEQUENCE 5-like [Primulina eburnea]|uniref:protein FAR1-RELATED SEQUENCE 5-like n=1 Tax=Primulina eburnea TaxID=1245227 RepID=UPI003C6BF16E